MLLPQHTPYSYSPIFLQLGWKITKPSGAGRQRRQRNRRKRKCGIVDRHEWQRYYWIGEFRFVGKRIVLRVITGRH